jgi:hypothetical protein
MYLTRHRDILGQIDLNYPINIIGAGSIGSYACLALAKLGFTDITIADDGKVEEENIAPQLYRLKDIGKFKVDCLKRMIKEQTGVDIIAIPTRINTLNTDHVEGGLTILAVDTMTARKILFVSICSSFFIDARMAIEFLTIISIKSGPIFNKQHKYYSDTLFDDSDAVQEACTNKAIAYTSLIAGGLIARTVMEQLRDKDNYRSQTLNFDINNLDMVRLICPE